MRLVALSLVSLVIVTSSIGCKSKAKPEYARPLPPGAQAIRKLSTDRWPDLRYALPLDDAYLTALRRSLHWFDIPSTKAFFPIEGITHPQAQIGRAHV